METLLPLFFVALFATFAAMLALCLYDMFRMARNAERRERGDGNRRGRSRRPLATDNLAFRARNASHRD